MIVEYTGRKTAITSKLKQLAEESLARIERVTNRCTSAHIVLKEDKYRQRSQRSQCSVATKACGQ